MAATRLIFISNFRLLVQRFCHILTNFLVALHLNIIFPRACTKILLLSVCSLVPEVCGVYSIVAVCTIWHVMPYGIVCISAIINPFRSEASFFTWYLVTRVTNACKKSLALIRHFCVVARWYISTRACFISA